MMRRKRLNLSVDCRFQHLGLNQLKQPQI